MRMKARKFIGGLRLEVSKYLMTYSFKNYQKATQKGLYDWKV